MFEVTGEDIANLGDGDLRSLVERLALAELASQGAPLATVTAGGHQDATDGGVDVRVSCTTQFARPDFVPRPQTGFQVKKSDMPFAAIRAEMRPKDLLREVIKDLAANSGAYIIVSSRTVADAPLIKRRKAMRAALADLPQADQLLTDFYDQARLKNWVNKYPGVVTWVRTKAGRALPGWSAIVGVAGTAPVFLHNQQRGLFEESRAGVKSLTILEGIDRLRAIIAQPGKCVRLVGLSGVGKTRMVQALFEKDIGGEPLDASLTVYTDYAEEPDPTGRQMAEMLVARGQRAILVVDNCNSGTHAQLRDICAANDSQVSLITVEYDVRDDGPGSTDVFRLESSAPELVTAWLKQKFPDISESDRTRIADFSGGNFRVANVLAETVGKGEALGSLRDQALFERIFHQRNQPDQLLLRAAESLALLYSVEGEDVSDEGELAKIGAIRKINPGDLFEALVSLRQRGIVQGRGSYRAILPEAIANPLAASALDKIPPDHFDRFCKSLTPRMLKSVSRRLGYLHDSVAACLAVTRWLKENGPLGDLLDQGEEGFQILSNIAPLSPTAVLTRLELLIDSAAGDARVAALSPGRYQLIRLVKALAYEPELFDHAAALLARFLAAEPENNTSNSARPSFAELFHLCLSGTLAPLAQRAAFIKRLVFSGDPALRRCASIALDALLEANQFSPSGGFEFGARSRGWGLSPELNGDIWDWFNQAIALAVDIAPRLGNVPQIIANNLRSLWRIEACRDALESAVLALFPQGAGPEGWRAMCRTLHYEGKNMTPEGRARLMALIDQLKPSGLLEEARAFILSRSGGWDLVISGDSEISASLENAARKAKELGRALAKDQAARAQFLPELFAATQAQHAGECGTCLAEGAEDLGRVWGELVEISGRLDPKRRADQILGGFLSAAHLRDPSFAAPALEAACNDPNLAGLLPYLQRQVGLDEEGITRLRRAIAAGILEANSFWPIIGSAILSSPPEMLASLLEDISSLSDGVDVAAEILHMLFSMRAPDTSAGSERLIAVGRGLLTRIDFHREGERRDFGLKTLIQICLAGEGAKSAARQMCDQLREARESAYLPSDDLIFTLEALFKTQPVIALDAFLLPRPTAAAQSFGWERLSEIESALEQPDPAVVEEWANADPPVRYNQLGKKVRMFTLKPDEDENEISPLFQRLLRSAPDKGLFLGNPWDRLSPRGSTTSLADHFVRRKAHIIEFAKVQDDQVKVWVTEAIPQLDALIEDERKRDRTMEERFE